MYIIKTYSDSVHIDYDELKILIDGIATGSKLIFFRRGAVNPNQIATVTDDEERMSSVKKRPGESDTQRLERIQSEKSEDVFEHIRTKSIINII